MKRISVLITLLLMTFLSHAQLQKPTIAADRIVANKKLFMKDRWINAFQNDINFLDSTKIPTSLAVKNFVGSRIDTLQIHYRVLSDSSWEQCYNGLCDTIIIHHVTGGSTLTFQGALSNGSALTTNNTVTSVTGRRYTQNTSSPSGKLSSHILDTSFVKNAASAGVNMSSTTVSPNSVENSSSSDVSFTQITNTTGSITLAQNSDLTNPDSAYYLIMDNNGWSLQHNGQSYSLPKTTPASGDILTAGAGGNTYWVSPKYTEFVCLLRQTGTADPTITVLENNTGYTFTCTRTAPGHYEFEPTSGTPFTANKTAVSISQSVPNNADIYVTSYTINSATQISIKLDNVTVDIEI